MKREELRDLLKNAGLSEEKIGEVVDSIMETNGQDIANAKKVDLKQYVPKDDYDKLTSDFNNFKESNKEAIEKYPTLQNDYNTLKETSAKELDDFKLSQFIEKELASKKVRNSTAMKAILKEKGFEFKLNEKKDGIDKESFNKAFDEAIKGNEFLINTGNAYGNRAGVTPGYDNNLGGNKSTVSISAAVKQFYENQK